MITYTKTIPSDKLCLAYNNNILEFGTDSTLDIINAQVSINGIIVVLYPHPDKSFYLNLKQYITTFFPQIKDDLDIDLLVSAHYDWTSKLYLNTDINITINFVDLSSETSALNTGWLSGYLQINTRAIVPNDELIVLTPQKVGSKEAFLKYWIGYPFDISVYKPFVNSLLFLDKYDNSVLDITTSFLINRIFFSDGLNQTGFFTSDEFNYFKLKIDEVELFRLNYQQLTPTCDNGFYIKWINSLGGYSYWLFEHWEQNSQYKDLGEINNNYSNLEDTLSKSIQIGKTSVNKVTVTTDTINENDLSILNDLFDSSKIYQFIGTLNTANNFNDWTEISLNTTSIPKNKTKFNLSNLQLTFELPTNDTRTI